MKQRADHDRLRKPIGRLLGKGLIVVIVRPAGIRLAAILRVALLAVPRRLAARSVVSPR